MGDAGTVSGEPRRDADDVTVSPHTPTLRSAHASTADHELASVDGELVAKALAGLSIAGWQVLHDRVMSTGDTIDHIVVGPGAVIVIDTKGWNGHLEVRDNRLYNDGWSQTKAITHLATQRGVIRDLLRIRVGSDGPVDMALVITTQSDFGPVSVGGTVVLGIGHLIEAISSTRPAYSREKVDEVVAVLSATFPAAGTVAPTSSGLHHIDGLELGDMFNRANRFVYLLTSRDGGRHHMHLHDEDGERIGSKDLSDGRVHLEHRPDPLAASVLRAATQTGLHFRPGDVPEVPVTIPDGRLSSLHGRLHSSVVVGNRWQGRGQDRLYGSLVNPAEGTFDLGYVDLTTGWVKPASRGPLSRERGPAERYLALLRDRCPFAYGPEGTSPTRSKASVELATRVEAPVPAAPTRSDPGDGEGEGDDTATTIVLDRLDPVVEPKQFDLPGS